MGPKAGNKFVIYEQDHNKTRHLPEWKISREGML